MFWVAAPAYKSKKKHYIYICLQINLQQIQDMSYLRSYQCIELMLQLTEILKRNKESIPTLIYLPGRYLGFSKLCTVFFFLKDNIQI